MTITAKAYVVAAVVSAFATVTFATVTCAAEGPEPGLWRITTRGLVPGAPGADTSRSVCITFDMASHLGAFFANQNPMRGAGDCRHTHQFTGITLSWQMSCAGPTLMSGAGTITFDSPQHYVGTFTTVGSMAGPPSNYSLSMEGQRLGECGQ